jgi:L-aspartate oxidase
MSADVGVVRHAAGLRHALETIARLEEATGASRFSNLTIAARLIAASALTREESRGGHFRSDFPEPRDIWKHRSFITDKEATALTGDKDHRRQKAIP